MTETKAPFETRRYRPLAPSRGGPALLSLLANWQRTAWRRVPPDRSAEQRWEAEGGNLRETACFPFQASRSGVASVMGSATSLLHQDELSLPVRQSP
jgi:hypothetical protein